VLCTGYCHLVYSSFSIIGSFDGASTRFASAAAAEVSLTPFFFPLYPNLSNSTPGGGTIDGNGQIWYDLYASNIYALRPTLIGLVGMHDATFSNLVLRYSPTYYHFVTNSTNVILDNINIAGGSVSKNLAKNTDGWDTYRVDDVTIQNSIVNNGDGESSLNKPIMRTQNLPKIILEKC
jgi:hypothetical protein